MEEELSNVNNALKDFYEEAILDASKQTGIPERDIRNWFQEKLITSSGTRSIIHRDRNSTGGINNKAVDILEGKYYLIRREWRSGASWYELTHDRLIKPITDSNTKWKYENERKKRNLVLKVAIPSLTVPVIVVSVILFLYVFSPHPLIPQPKSLQIIGDGPIAVSVNPSTNIVYVANYDNNTVSVIDGKTNRVIANVTVGTSPNAVSVNPLTNIVYVTNYDDNTVSVIDGKSNKVITTISVGTSPNAVSVNPSTNTAYVANRDDNTVSVIDGKTNRVIANVTGRYQSLWRIGKSINQYSLCSQQWK